MIIPEAVSVFSEKGRYQLWRDIFNPENLFFRILARGVDLVGLSLLCVFLSLPVVTAGAAAAALYYTVVKVFRQGRDDAFTTYIKAFRDNLKQGMIVTLFCIPVIIFLAWGYNVMANNISTSAGQVMYMAYYVVLLVPAGVFCYLFPLMGRFEFETGALLRTAFIMAIRHIPSTLVIVLLTVEMIIFTIEKWWPLLIAPVIVMFLSSLFLEKIFLKYLSKEEIAVLTGAEQEEDDFCG